MAGNIRFSYKVFKVQLRLNTVNVLFERSLSQAR
jgi:hypothetical protein